ncbi:sodium-coupled monocarboxylate transporter 2 [Leptinotarsa decemlineata]|uniref:sodium-coupled monocarboxylate transporter 2 n=1 Tax=Leptinotarsa decemlineata TaxID=7539 RepID=UPI003D306F9A
MEDVIKWKSLLTKPKLLINISVMIILFNSVAAARSQKNLEKDMCSEENFEKNFFSWADYLILGAMLVISCGIGVFYGVFNTHENSEDFLLGGSTMGTFPMATSLAASFVTAVELLGNPAEMYSHGSQFWMICVAFILVVPLTSKLYLPVYMNLRLTSSYEYLSLRFSSKTRYLASVLYVFQMVLYTSVAVYAPALALSKVTGINVYLAVTIVYAVCIFYASQGGMKAIIITDTFQTVILVGSLVLILVLANELVGGTEFVWSHNYKTNRLEIFNFDPNVTVRHSFWSVVVGGTFYWLTMFCSNQATIQKYLSVEHISQVRSAIWISSFGLIMIYSINFYTGMILVAHFKDCDPLQIGEITAADEILPYYVINILGRLKGVTGFFVAGIFAASLGTVASALNSLAAVTMEDFMESAFGIRIPKSRGAIVAKVLTIAYGAGSFGLVFLVANSGSVMQVAISFNGMVGGVTLGLFSLGMFVPWANSKGAMCGSVIAAGLITLMCVGQQIAIASGNLEEPVKTTSSENCAGMNLTVVVEKRAVHNTHVFVLYRVSYIWYSAIGCLTTIALGVIISFATGATKMEDLDDELLSPPIRNLLYSLPSRMRKFMNIPSKPSYSDERPEKGKVFIDLDSRSLQDYVSQTSDLGKKFRRTSSELS